MADTSHTIHAKLDFDDGNIAKRLKLIEQQFKRMEKTVARMDRRGSGMNDRFKKLDNRLGKLGRTVSGLFRGFTRLFTMFAKFSFIAMAGEIALFTAGLLAVKLALITGRAAASLYNIALKGLSVTAAGVATALATAAAAMRQFQEAQLSPFLGGGATGRGQVARMGRGFGAMTSGLLGGQGTMELQGALARAGFSGRTGIGLGQQVSALFNYDPKAAAQFIGTLGQARTTGSLGPALQALTSAPGFAKNTNISATNLSGLVGLINSGNVLSPAFANQGSDLSRTFIGTAKTSFVGIRDMFADAGDDLLGPMRDSFLQIANILRENFLGLQVIIQRFGADSMGPTMVTIFDRMMRFITENIIDHLGNIKEMGENFVGFFRSVRNFFVGMGDFLGKYEPAANVIIDMFKAASNANKSSLFRDFSRGLVANADSVKKFGSSMGRLMGGIFGLFEAGNNAFFGGGIDRIDSVVNAIVDEVFPAMKDFFGAASPIMERLPTILEMIADGLRMLTPVMSGLFQVIGALVDSMKFLGAGGLLGVGMLGMTGRGRRGVGMMRGGKGLKGLGAGFLPALAGFTGGNMIADAFMPTLYGRNTQDLFGVGMPNFNTQATFAGGGAMLAYALASLGMTGGASLPAVLLAGAVAGVGTAFGVDIVGDIGRKLGIFEDPEKIAAKEGLRSFRDITAGGSATGKFNRANLFSINRRFVFDNDSFLKAAGIDSNRTQFDYLRESQGLYNTAFETYMRTGEFDSEDSRKLLTYLGYDAESTNVKETVKGLFNMHTGGEFADYNVDFAGNTQNTLERLSRIERQNTMAGVSGATLALGQFAQVVAISGEAVTQFAKNLGFDMMNISKDQSRVLGIMAAAASMLFSRDLALLPDIGGSGLARVERNASASAALNALLAGDMSTASINDFLGKYASYEISLGNNADVAGLSGLVHLQRRLNAGEFGTNTARMQDVVNTGTDAYFRDLSARTFIPEDTLREIFEGGGGMTPMQGPFGRSGVSALDAHLTKQLKIRQAISGTAGMGFMERQKILTGQGFNFMANSTARKAFINSLVDQTGNQSLNEKVADPTGKFNAYMQAHLNQGTISEDQMARALSIAFVEEGFSGDQLEGIRLAIVDLPDQLKGVLTVVNINGSDGTDGADTFLELTSAGSGGGSPDAYMKFNFGE